MNETNPTDNTTTSSNEHQFSPEEKILTEIQMYYTPILVLLGTTGNCLSVIVFATAKLRQLSSSYYLAGLAISDTGYLISLFFVWLNLVDVPLFNEHGFCQALMYCSHLCSFLSVWFVVAFTVERFVAVRYPLHRPSMCTVTRAKTVLFGLTILGMLLYGPVLFIVAPVYVESWKKETCELRPEYMQLAEVFNVVDTVLTFLLPFVAIAVLNAGIASTVWQLARIRRTMTRRPHRTSMGLAGELKPQRGSSVRLTGLTLVKAGGTECESTLENASMMTTKQQHPRGGSGGVQALRSQHSAHSQAKITKMLLLVSTVFVCLNLPSYVLRLWVYIRNPQEEERGLVIILQHASILLFSTNFGINFVLYCVSGQNFRRALSALCRSGDAGALGRRRTAGDISQTTVSEYQRAGSFLSRRRTATAQNGSSWPREAHEMLPLSAAQ